MEDKVHYREQIDRILSSHALHGSESLCKLLRYLADHSLGHPAAAPKEYQIATKCPGQQKCKSHKRRTRKRSVYREKHNGVSREGIP